ncbi:YrdB family protein [Embleya sp. NPDC005575]|uniref:YrdB family protein n=1 Tax=Embleya sp. NPDC005575 TaxID=3156892 RepID=UPI0033ADEB85
MIVLYWTAMVALFLAELAATGATAFWGFTLDAGRPIRILVGLAAPAVMMFLWGRFAAANNADALTGLPRILFEAAWWGAGIAAFVAAGLLPGAIGVAVARLTGLAAQRSKAHAQRGARTSA